MSLENHAGTPTGSSDESVEHIVFHGLRPRSAEFEKTHEPASHALRKSLMGSIPLLMTGTLATGIVVAPPSALQETQASDNPDEGSHRMDSRPGFADRLQTAILPVAQVLFDAVRPDLPATYEVQAGDSPSSIAERFGIPTPAILTLNGLGWNAVLHEGQVIKLNAEATKKKASSPARVAKDGYLVQNGETASEIADRLGISTDALLRHNNLEPTAVIYAGQFIKIPGVSAPVVERDVETVMPIIAQAPTIIPASVSDETPIDTESEDSGEDAFDAADIALAEKPALIVAKIAPKVVAPVVVEKKEEPVVVQKKEAAAPVVSQASEPEEDEAAAAPSGVGQPKAGSVTPLNDERRSNAQIIIAEGRELGVSDYGIVIALATAMQESSLRNLNWGDRDSLGLFQQRPSSGWGSAEQIMDPAYSTKLFFGGPSNPNKGKTRGLLDISGWESMALTVAAQAVQISGHPTAYAKWEASAWAWLYELT